MSATPREIAQALGLPAPTPEQVEVICAPPRPLLVVAGAGSGKTETMAGRVVWLVANGYLQPDQVLGLTFTRKAATELAERLTRRLCRLRQVGLWRPAEQDDAEVLGGTPTVSTYHAYAGRLVSEHGLLLGVEPDTRLLTEAACWQFAAEVVESYDGPMDRVDKAASTVTAAVVDLAGEMAEHLLDAGDVESYLGDLTVAIRSLPATGKTRGIPARTREVLDVLDARRQIVPIVRRYQDLKRSRDALGFADQMALAARLATAYPEVGRGERARFSAVLLDEFQDTSEAQLALLSALFAQPTGSACVTAVGDPHQSIYGWRGASAGTLARFPAAYADRNGPANTLQLSTSWRNDEAILAVANAVVTPLRGGSLDAKRLAPRPGAGRGTVDVARLITVEDEATHVAGWLAERWFDDGGAHTGTSAAVLCRKRSGFAPIVAALAAAGLPVEVVGIGGLIDTPEVGDIVALLHAVQDPTRGDQLIRLLAGPTARIGAADLDGLATWSRLLLRRDTVAEPGVRDLAPDSEERPSLVEALDDLPGPEWVGQHGERISTSALLRLRGLGDVLTRLRALTALPLSDLVDAAERALGLDIEVLARPEHTPASARAHLDAFRDVAADFAGSADRPTLLGFLAWLDAARAEERGLDAGVVESSGAAVQVLTVHAAKGLEWDLVAVPAMVDGTFPDRAAAVAKFVDGCWRTPAVSEKAWCVGLSSVPYPLRGDRSSLPELGWEDAVDLGSADLALSEFYRACGEHALAEERRLAYVAVTRARTAVLMTASVWSQGSTPRAASRFLAELIDDPADPANRADPGATGARREGDGSVRAREAVREWVGVGSWAAMPDPDENGKASNPRNASTSTASWPADPLARRRVALADGAHAVLAALRRSGTQQQGGDVPSSGSGSASGTDGNASVHRSDDVDPLDRLDDRIEVLLAEHAARRRPAREVALPGHLSASALVSLATNADRFALDLRRPMPSPPADAARRGMDFHAWVERHYRRAGLLDVLDLPGAADDHDGASADEGAPTDGSLMRQRFLDSPWAGRDPVEIELALETVIGSVAIRGRIDAVFTRDDGGFTIVDWKTGTQPQDVAARTAALQLAVYRYAFCRLRGLRPEQVGAVFYYAGTGRSVWPELPSDDVLHDLVLGAGLEDGQPSGPHRDWQAHNGERPHADRRLRGGESLPTRERTA